MNRVQALLIVLFPAPVIGLYAADPAGYLSRRATSDMMHCFFPIVSQDTQKTSSFFLFHL